ncbi:hypothetical protein HOP51_07070 [Halomonas sp. MCCC 1A11036]|uniref:Flagellar hook-length control protein-like C-terminal domain-containing protein n=1 Tax=Billgrantia zhangzhouensis TaxID=2733481 RepID=A0ABS9ADS4_9GAMM|nr:flagellar hook-length control protein FliK [Halomonas zhangzhouensis]MCE8019876.1 hypothetical protein [Halomonas zhangzhouensis]
MNIHMILSALPPQLSGKPESSASQGQFALALSQAGQSGQADGAALPPSFAGMSGQVLPHTMAAQQALLQALNANAGQQLDGEAESALPNAELSEIMARLALIEGNSQQEPVVIDSQPLPEQEATLPTDEVATELAEQPQAAARAAALRPAEPLPTPGTARLDTPAALKAAAPGNPLAAQLGNAGSAADADSADAERNSNGVSRAIDPASVFAKSQSGAPNLRTGATDQPRGGFVPEAASMTQPGVNASTTAGMPGQAVQQPSTQASLTAPLQSPAWPNQLGQQLVQFARHGGEQQVEMRLNPAELGPLSVTLKMTEQGAQAQFLSAHAQVRQVLEQAIPQLREALAEQGISLGETSVGEQHRQDAQAFAGNDGQRGQGGSFQDDEAAALPGMEESGMTPSSVTLPLDGRVNLYA